MPRVGEFCAANITRLLLGVFIILGLFLFVGYWIFYSPGKGNSIEHPASRPANAQ
jgi:hypothetical protein